MAEKNNRVMFMIKEGFSNIIYILKYNFRKSLWHDAESMQLQINV